MSKSQEQDIPKTLRAAHNFIRAGKENREYIAYLAYRERIEWPYSIPLSSVVSYLKWAGSQRRYNVYADVA